MLSGGASRPASVTGRFGRESSNSAEQTFTVVAVGFMVAPADDADDAEKNKRMNAPAAALRAIVGAFGVCGSNHTFTAVEILP